MTVTIPLLVAAATIAVAGVWPTVIAVRCQVVLAGVAGVLGLAGVASTTARGLSGHARAVRATVHRSLSLLVAVRALRTLNWDRGVRVGRGR